MEAHESVKKNDLKLGNKAKSWPCALSKSWQSSAWQGCPGLVGLTRAEIRNRPLGTCFWEIKLYRDTAVYMFPAAALCSVCWVIVTGAERSARPKVFTLWPFMEDICLALFPEDAPGLIYSLLLMRDQIL